MSDYATFIEAKKILDPPSGLAKVPELSAQLFPFQRDIVAWALRRGRAAIFADCGLGKTPMQLECATRVADETDCNVLILAPLAVAEQTVREGQKFGIEVTHARTAKQIGRLTITNYERLEHFDPARFSAVVLDESSILKSFDGATSSGLIEAFQQTPYRLACTATPAPNDFIELGTHAEFVGALTRPEMLATFFVHDGGETQKWRLRQHGVKDFWQWLASWAVVIRRPSDVGYADDGFTLPPLEIEQRTVAQVAGEGSLFALEAQTLPERLAARRDSVNERAAECAALVNSTPGTWVIWCNLNAEPAKKRR